MAKRYQVFVSSTFLDLKNERQEVIKALLELDCIPAGMELFPAADETQWNLIKKVINECDYYVLILAGRYGSLTANGISYTEREYRYALSKRIPTLAFLHHDPTKLIGSKKDKTRAGEKRLAHFRKYVSRKLYKPWNTSQQLGGIVSRSLSKLIEECPAIGWVRANTLTTSPVHKTQSRWACRTVSPITCFQDNCVPTITNKTLKLLIPSRNHLYVDERNYSEEFSAALPEMNDNRKWRAFLEPRIKGDGSVDLNEAPRVFLVCAYPPLRIVEAIIRRLLGALTDGDRSRLGDTLLSHFTRTYRDAEAAFRCGLWRSDARKAEEELEYIVKAGEILFPHFEQVRSRHDGLCSAIRELADGGLQKTVADKLHSYRDDSAIVRLLLKRKGDRFLPSDVSDSSERDALKQAWKVFWRLNASIPCYLADVEYLSTQVTDGALLPYTDFAIVTHVNKDRVIEIWDFYEESHLLITHGRPRKCVIKWDVTPYEHLMGHWRDNHGRPNSGPAKWTRGYLRISRAPTNSKGGLLAKAPKGSK